MERWNNPNLHFLVETFEPKTGLAVAYYVVSQVSNSQPSAVARIRKAVESALHDHSLRDGFDRRILYQGDRAGLLAYCMPRNIIPDLPF